MVREEVNKYDAELTGLQINQNGNLLQMSITLRRSELLSYQDMVALQEKTAICLQRLVAIVINQVLISRLDAHIPPTYTPTATPLTLMPTPSFTSTFTLTPTATATPTPTATLTPTATANPSLGRIANTQGLGARLRQSPGGPLIAALGEGTRVTILYGYAVVDGLVWLEVRDEAGRVGWIPQIYLIVVTLTPSLTPSATITPTP